MIIGITIGDINGIGPEVILKTFEDSRIYNQVTPIVYGSGKVMSYHKNLIPDCSVDLANIQSIEKANKEKLNIINCWDEEAEISLGTPTKSSGKFAGIALEKAVEDLQEGKIDCLVTAPINKEAMQLAGWKYPGHTEFLDEKLEGNNLMMLINDDLRVALVTNHIPVSDITNNISKKLIRAKLNILHKSLITDFGIDNPKIAVLGLNPHASDNGNIGVEENDIIDPAILELKKSGKLIFGPYPADGFFGSSNFKKFDAILAMYHDQGLVPFKTLSFGNGTNFTAGLSHVRTSPDHGTGYDIAGKNLANISSFQRSLFNAIDIVKSRKSYESFRENKLIPQKANQ